MKKRTYKQMQNRLYREIKRRIAAEQRLATPLKLTVEHYKIETLKIKSNVNKRMIPSDASMFAEHIKRDMAHEMAVKLVDEGYISFYTKERYDGYLYDYTEIEARLNVVRQT